MKNKLILILVIGFMTFLSSPAFSQSTIHSNTSSTTNPTIHKKFIEPSSVGKGTTVKQSSTAQTNQTSVTPAANQPARKKFIEPASMGNQSSVKQPITATPNNVTQSSTVTQPAHKKFIQPNSVKVQPTTTNTAK